MSGVSLRINSSTVAQIRKALLSGHPGDCRNNKGLRGLRGHRAGRGTAYTRGILTNTYAYNKWQTCTRSAPARHICTRLPQGTSALIIKSTYFTLKINVWEYQGFKLLHTWHTVWIWPTWEAVFIHSQQVSSLIQVAAQMVARSTWKHNEGVILYVTIPYAEF